MSTKLQIIIALALVAILASGMHLAVESIKKASYDSGKSSCEATQAIAVIQHSGKVKKGYAKIEHSIPNLGDTAAVDNFLLTHTR